MTQPADPIPMLLWCPECNARHVDVGEFATKVHHTHACQACGNVWRPAVVATCGVQFLPGFKNPDEACRYRDGNDVRCARPALAGQEYGWCLEHHEATL